jgi:hypothetical protein
MEDIGGNIKIIKIMRTKGLTFLLLLFCCVSCDTSTPLIIEGDKIHTISTECGNIKIAGATMFHEHIFCELNGKFTIKFDSLKIQLVPNTIEVANLTFYYSDKEITDLKEIININGTEKISIRFDYKSDISFNKKSVLILLLPSNFITCEGKPIITDTIRIQLKN